MQSAAAINNQATIASTNKPHGENTSMLIDDATNGACDRASD